MTAFATGQSRFLPVGGGNIHYQHYNADDQGKPGLLFVHGMWAHSHWWDHIAPSFLDHFAVAAIDLAPSTPDELRSFVQSEIDRWGPVIRKLDLKAQ